MRSARQRAAPDPAAEHHRRGARPGPRRAGQGVRLPGLTSATLDLLRALRAAVGERHVLTGDAAAGHAVDWTGRFTGRAAAVARPGSVDEVVAVVGACAAAGVPLVPQGGNTGLVGGSVPRDGEVVLSLRRLDAVGDVDPVAGQLTAGAGATLASVQAAAGAAGWDYGVDFTARDSATIGGTVATDAGGLRVLRHGTTRAQLLGIEAVLADGSVVRRLGGVLKDATGYDLAHLLCGSEGTLGVVTAARLRLVPRHDERVAALLAFGAVADAVAAAGDLRRRLASLDAAELVVADGVDLVCERYGLAQPFPTRHPALLVVECAAAEDPTAALAAAVEDLAGVVDAAVASDGARRVSLWRYREAHTEALNLIGPPHKLDVAVPLSAIADLVAAVPAAVAAVAPTARTWVFGHVADGNLHVNVTGVAPDDDSVDEAVVRLVLALGGSTGAEHGVGTAKKRWLALDRSPADLAAMRAVKAALDPRGILNPNVLLPPA